MTDGVRAMLMRGGTSKGLFFLDTDLPAPGPERDSSCSGSWDRPIPARSTASGAPTP